MRRGAGLHQIDDAPRLGSEVRHAVQPAEAMRLARTRLVIAEEICQCGCAQTGAETAKKLTASQRQTLFRKRVHTLNLRGFEPLGQPSRQRHLLLARKISDRKSTRLTSSHLGISY